MFPLTFKAFMPHVLSCQELGPGKELSSDSDEEKDEEDEDSGMADTSTSCSGGETRAPVKQVTLLPINCHGNFQFQNQ